MSTIVRIDNNPQAPHRPNITPGWQARAYVADGKYLSRFFSDSRCGGSRWAKLQAKTEAERLGRKAKKLQRERKRLKEMGL